MTIHVRKLHLAVAVLAIALIAPATAWATHVFDDVEHDRFYADAAEWAAAEGITTGVSTNPPRFAPDDPVTRGQNVTFLKRYHDHLVQPGLDALEGPIAGNSSAIVANDTDIAANAGDIASNTAELEALETAIGEIEGVVGAYTVSAVDTVAALTTLWRELDCNPGDLMTGGGYDVTFATDVVPLRNGPGNDPESWRVRVENRDPVNSAQLQTVVRCLDVTP